MAQKSVESIDSVKCDKSAKWGFRDELIVERGFYNVWQIRYELSLSYIVCRVSSVVLKREKN